MTKEHFERTVTPLIAALPGVRLNSVITSKLAGIARAVAAGTSIDDALSRLDAMLQNECHVKLDRHMLDDLRRALR